MAIECARCKSKNPQRKNFCGMCGAPLNPSAATPEKVPDSAIRERVLNVLRDHYKDQKVLEIETSQAVVARLGEWAKLFAFFVGIPVTLGLIFLSVAGVRTYSDFSRQIQQAQTDISTKLENAQKVAARLQSDSVIIAKDYEKLAAGLENTKSLASRVESLSSQYEKVAAQLASTQQLADRIATLDQKIVNIAESVRSALVFGNGNYVNPRLGNLLGPQTDARRIADALGKVGFNVTTALDSDRNHMMDQLQRFSEKLVPGDTAFIFFSGHGVSLDGVNYLLPIDLPPIGDDGAGIRFGGIPEGDIITMLSRSNARAIVLVIDACRSQLTASTKGIATIEPLKPQSSSGPDTFILYSASDDQVALDRTDDAGAGSVFAQVLASELIKPGLSVRDLAEKVMREVWSRTSALGRGQRPMYHDATAAPVYLAGRTDQTK